MSTVVSKNLQVGTSGTPAQNFTLYQPATPDGTVRLANGNSGSTTDLLTVNAAGAITQSAATANGVMFANGSKVLTTGSALTFNGAQLMARVGASGAVFQNTSDPAAAVAHPFVTANVATGFSSSPAYGFWYQTTGISNPASETMGFVANGNEQMRLTSTGLGIGTTSPAAKLNVNSGSTGLVAVFDSTNANGGYLLGRSSGTAVWDLGTAKQTFGIGGATDFGINVRSGFLSLGTGNTERLRLDSSGNLGLGVTPSAWNPGIRVFEFGSLGGLAAATNDVNLISNVYFDGVNRYRTNNFATNFQSTSGQFRWLTAPSGTAGNAISFTQAMTLDASGNLGVGTTSPSNRLNVVSTSTDIVRFDSTSASNYGEILIRSNGGVGNNTRGRVVGGFDAGGSGFGGFLAFNTTTTQNVDTERARIDSSGNLLVGTLDAGFNARQLIRFEATGSSTNGLAIWNGGGSGAIFAAFSNTGGGFVGTITQSGTTAVLYNTTSDYRLKTVIGPVADAGQRIDALQPVEYTWNSNGERTRGFLAHQFQEVYAGSVSGTKDAADAEGKPVYQSMQASTPEVIADLVAEIQSLRARITALESN